MKLHKFKMDEGLFLDGFRLRGVSAYHVEQNENNDFACLTLKMDVSLLGNTSNVDLNTAIDEELDKCIKKFRNATHGYEVRTFITEYEELMFKKSDLVVRNALKREKVK